MAPKKRQAKDIVIYTQNTSTYAWIKRGSISPDGTFKGDDGVQARLVNPIVEQHKLDLTKPEDREKFCFYFDGAYASAVEE